MLFSPAVLFVIALLYKVEWGCGDVNAAVFNQFLHVTEEEGKDKRGDMASVHIGIGHDDDLMVPELIQVKRLGVFIRTD